MNTISLLQPWAWFVVHGFKQWETRSWVRPSALGPLLIHASAKTDPLGRHLYSEARGLYGDTTFSGLCPPWGELPRGCILGQVTCAAFVQQGSEFAKVLPLEISDLERLLGDFTPGRWLWRLAHPVAFTKPIPAKGRLGIWQFHGQLP